MRFPTAVLLAVIALCGGLGFYGWTLGAAARTPVVQPGLSGMGQLAAYRCAKPERKVVLIRGVEDGFSPAGVEPIFLRPERRTPALLSLVREGAYDQTQPDIGFADSLETPARVVRGVFVIGLRGLEGSPNDFLLVGEIPTQETANATGKAFRSPLPALAAQPGWRVNGEVYSAELENLTFFEGAAGKPRNLLEHLRSHSGPGWVDVSITDDTSVDFIGMAVCVAPPQGKGMTFYVPPSSSRDVPGTVVLGCNPTRDDRFVCDPYVGDTPCDTPLPVACIRPNETPAPATFSRLYSGRLWSGGALAAAPPSPASRFRTISEVDAYCARNLGQGWRALEAHDGLGRNLVAGRGDRAGFEPRAWLDIADQPYATCWAR
ncbi:MAG: hypothetical protein Q8L23_06800 [Caulobacter sp.]|nr:hypothetical protein [Caulobacter sp.]